MNVRTPHSKRGVYAFRSFGRFAGFECIRVHACTVMKTRSRFSPNVRLAALPTKPEVHCTCTFLFAMELDLLLRTFVVASPLANYLFICPFLWLCDQ